MNCPICNKNHRKFPNNCWKIALEKHLIICGITHEHKDNCFVIRMREYIIDNWKIWH